MRRARFRRDVVKQMGAMGLMGVIFPEELGGSGYGYVEYVLAIEELSRVDGSVGIVVASHKLALHESHHAGRQCGAEEAVGFEAGEWRVARRVGVDGAGFGVGCGRDADDCGEGGWRVGC